MFIDLQEDIFSGTIMASGTENLKKPETDRPPTDEYGTEHEEWRTTSLDKNVKAPVDLDEKVRVLAFIMQEHARYISHVFELIIS